MSGQRAVAVRELYCAVLSVLSVMALARLKRPGDRLALCQRAWPWSCSPDGDRGARPIALSAASRGRVRLLGTTSSVCRYRSHSSQRRCFAALALRILKDLAPTRLRLTGATAGFAAGSLEALIIPCIVLSSLRHLWIPVICWCI